MLLIFFLTFWKSIISLYLIYFPGCLHALCHQRGGQIISTPSGILFISSVNHWGYFNLLAEFSQWSEESWQLHFVIPCCTSHFTSRPCLLYLNMCFIQLTTSLCSITVPILLFMFILTLINVFLILRETKQVFLVLHKKSLQGKLESL